MIEFVLDGRSRLATYVQLVQQVKQALRVGLLERKVRTAPLMARSWTSQGAAVEPTRQGVPRA